MRAIRKFLCLIIACAIVSHVQSQSLPTEFKKAFALYESGDYSASLNKVIEIENVAGRTNPKIQSLKILIYNNLGENEKTVLELEKYFRTSPDSNSSEYNEMKTLYAHLKKTINEQYHASVENLHKQFQSELQAIDRRAKKEAELYLFTVAKEASTFEAYTLFLKNCTNDSLRNLTMEFLENEKRNEEYDRLIQNGFDFLEEQSPELALASFNAAQKLKNSTWLTEQIKFSKDFHGLLTLIKGDEDFLHQNWQSAVVNYTKSLSATNSPETKAKLAKANEELFFEKALKENNVTKIEQFIADYPTARKRNQAIDYLFNYYLMMAQESRNIGDHYKTRDILKKFNSYSGLEFWGVYADDYYNLLKLEAKRLTEGSRSKRKQYINIAINYYEELQSSTEKSYKSKIRYLTWLDKEWSREDISYLLFKTGKEFNDIGFEFGSIKNEGIGFATTFVAAKQLYSEPSDEERFETNLTYTRSYLNLNLTKKIVYPFSVYLGLGYSFYHPIWRDVDNPGLGYIPYDIDPIQAFSVESGFTFSLRPIVLTIGASFPFLNDEQKLVLGIKRNSKLDINFGIGITI